MTRKTIWIALILTAVALAPLFAQTTTTGTTTTTTTTTTMHTAKTHTMMHKAKTGSTTVKTRAWTDATRLGALLRDVQANINVDSAAWKTVANEANSLANRLYGETGSSATARKAAREARTHVRAMRTAALAGDAAGARQHATEAMPYVMQVADWAAPAQ